MPKIKSSAVLPARYVFSNMTVENINSQHALESNEDTLSAIESDGTLTEEEVDSDSTVFNDCSLKKLGHQIFKLKDEAPDSDGDNNSKQQGISTFCTVIKQEPLYLHEDNTSGANNSNLNPNVANPFSSNENETSVASSEKVVNSVDHQYISSNVRIKEEKYECVAASNLKIKEENDTCILVSNARIKEENDSYGLESNLKIKEENDSCVLEYNVRIKEENDSCVTDTCALQTADISSQQKAIENKLVNHISESLFVKENYVSDNSPLTSNHLEFLSTDAVKHSDNDLSHKDSTHESNKVNYAYDSSLKIQTENPIIREANSDVLHSSGCESETCTENMETPILPNAAFYTMIIPMNQTSQTSPIHPSLSINNYDSVSNASESFCNENEMKNLKSSEISDVLTVNSLDTVAIEKQNVCLYNSEAENADISFSHFNSTDSVLNMLSHSAVSGDNESVSQNSILNVQSKITVNSCVSPKDKSSTVSENESYAATSNDASVISSPKKKICQQDTGMTPPSAKYSTSANSHLPRDLIEYSSFYLHFSRSEIEKCLQFINKKKTSKPFLHPLFLGSGKVKVRKSNVFPAIINAETVNMPCVKELSTPVFISENSKDVAAMTVGENFSTDSDNLKICDQNKYCELPSTEKENSVSEATSFTETVMTSKEENIKYDNSKVCDQNMFAEIPLSKNNVDNENSSNDSKCVRILPEVPNSEVMIKSKEKSTVKCDQNMNSEIQSSQNNDGNENSFASNLIKTEIQSSQNNDGNENSLTSNLIKTEIIAKVNTCTDSVSCKSACHVQSSSGNIPTITLVMQNENTSLIKIKQEQMLETGTESLTSDVVDTSLQSNTKLFSEESNTLSIPSVKDLQKIIETSLLNDTLSSKNKFNPLKDVEIKMEHPEIEEITLDGDMPVPSNINIAQPTYDSTPTDTEDDIEVLLIKRKSLKNTQNRACKASTEEQNELQISSISLFNRSDCNIDALENVNKINRDRPNNFDVEENLNTQNEPPVKKRKIVAYKENSMFLSTSSFTFNEKNDYCYTCKRKIICETRNKKKFKSEEKEDVKASLPNCAEKNLKQVSDSFDRIIDSTVLSGKLMLISPAVSISSKANKVSSTFLDGTSNNEGGALASGMYSEASASDNNCWNPSKSMNEISPCNVNIKAFKPPENNYAKLQTNSSDRDYSNMIVSSTNVTYSKEPFCEKKKQNLSQLKNETVFSEANKL